MTPYFNRPSLLSRIVYWMGRFNYVYKNVIILYMYNFNILPSFDWDLVVNIECLSITTDYTINSWLKMF